MATSIELPRQADIVTRSPEPCSRTRMVPLSVPTVKMSAQSNGDAMDVSPTNGATPGQPTDGESNGKPDERTTPQNSTDKSAVSSNSQMLAPPPAAAAAVHQPKIVQTAFIHKLYNMLEDPNIQHLISWSSTAESFIMSPSADFSKVLSQYFKHTNISSFVRQLNMYGFHKERDVFHTGSPDTTLWEFKHGNGNFKRGDLAGLREIKRRASRHALVNRETSYPKPSSTQPGTPVEPVQLPPESTDARLTNLEHSIYELSARLQRSEEGAHFMHVKQQAAVETMRRSLQFSQELSRTLLSLVPPESPLHRDVSTLQNEMARQGDVIRSLEEPHETPYTGRPAHYSDQVPPVSPRQLAQDDSRRGTLGAPQARGSVFHRPPVSSSLATGGRRPYGSVSATSPPQPSPLRHAPVPAAAAAAPQPHPLSNVEPHPNSLTRRHTAADIRAPGWQGGVPPYPTQSMNPQTGPWPPSPNHGTSDDQRIRESLSSFSLQNAASHAPALQSRPTTPPPPFSNGSNHNSDAFGSWSWNSALRDKNSSLRESSAPSTRRGSMAHILNPSDTAERSDEDEELRGEEDRKRKRI